MSCVREQKRRVFTYHADFSGSLGVLGSITWDSRLRESKNFAGPIVDYISGLILWLMSNVWSIHI